MFVVLFLAFVVQTLGGDGADVGIIRGMQAVGGIVGGLLLARVATRPAPATLIGLGFGGMAVWGFVTWNLPALTTADPRVRRRDGARRSGRRSPARWA